MRKGDRARRQATSQVHLPLYLQACCELSNCIGSHLQQLLELSAQHHHFRCKGRSLPPPSAHHATAMRWWQAVQLAISKLSRTSLYPAGTLVKATVTTQQSRALPCQKHVTQHQHACRVGMQQAGMLRTLPHSAAHGSDRLLFITYRLL